jgi:predicted HAD superfamily Cof-like phosphohydrolase
MSMNWVADMGVMHEKYGVNPVVREFDKDKLMAFLKFRIDFLQEELDEMRDAVVKVEAGKIDAITAADDVVDALIDLCVVAIGTLDAYNVNAYTAWNDVYEANMAKEVGVKASRPNPLGLPDLIKPEGWVAPTHKDNVGLIVKAFE